MLKDKSIQDFLDELASASATPGGGSSAALSGAMGAALVSMVCNLTIGKLKYASVEADMQKILKRSEALRERLTDMIRADVEGFDRVMAAYRMPKETEGQQAVRNEEIEAALKSATDVPLECAGACAEVIELSKAIAEQGNFRVISDAGVAVQAGYGALKGAALNVYINAAAIKDRAFAERRVVQLEKILRGADVETEEIYQFVKSKL